MTIVHTPIVVGTDGTPERDREVREAARLAHARNVPLHVVCSVPRLTARAQRELDGQLPADMPWARGHAGQCGAAVAEAVSMALAAGVQAQATATSRRLAPALRATAGRVGGEIYSSPRGGRLGLSGLLARARATA
jgi:nucleotide-binding universal stress UspA family protein